MNLLLCYMLLFISPLLKCKGVDRGYQILKNNTSQLRHNRRFGAKPTHKIVGGTTAGLDEFPWMVKLIYVEDHVWRFGCAGSLINSIYVLTAAHCVTVSKQKKRLPGDLDMIELGTRIPGNELSLQHIRVDRSIWHEQFNEPGDFVNDIALVRLARRVLYNEFILVANLYTKELPPNSRLWVSGWGSVDDHQTESETKMKVSIPLFGLRKCDRIWQSIDNMAVSKKQICAGGESGKDSCSGDSGGPLMLFENGKWFVVGLVSYGSPWCGQPGVPAVHTKISSYIKWINTHM